MRTMIALAAGLGIATTAFAAQKLGEYQPERTPEQTYAQICGYCHGRNVGPILLGRQLPPESIRLIARHGQNGMPAFRPTEVTEAELDALATWISASKADAKEHGQ